MPQMRRPSPRSLCVLAAGIVLAAGSGGTPPPAAPAAGPPAGGAELTAAEIGVEQQRLALTLMDALGSAGWTQADGAEYSATAAVAPRTAPCPSSAAGPRRHILTTSLTGPPQAAPERARDAAQQILSSAGTDPLSTLTPGPDAPPETDFTFVGTHAGSTVYYSVNEYRQTLEISSRCSADPSLGKATGTPVT